MEIFNNEFITMVKAEIERQLAGSDPVTRKSVLLNLGLDEESIKDAELALSSAFKLGCFPEYAMFQKIGIKPSSHLTTKDKMDAARKIRESKKAEPKRKLHPNISAKSTVTVSDVISSVESEEPSEMEVLSEMTMEDMSESNCIEAGL